MRTAPRIRSDETGVAVIETAFALPILIVMIWMFIQLAEVYRALAGMQHALGQGARYATLCLTPTAAAGCSRPSADDIKRKIDDSVPAGHCCTGHVRHRQILRSHSPIFAVHELAVIHDPRRQRHSIKKSLGRGLISRRSLAAFGEKGGDRLLDLVRR
jgi:hypothetical protein